MTMLEYIKARNDANKAFLEKLKLDAKSGNEEAKVTLDALIAFHTDGNKRQPGWYVLHPEFDPDNLRIDDV